MILEGKTGKGEKKFCAEKLITAIKRKRHTRPIDYPLKDYPLSHLQEQLW